MTVKVPGRGRNLFAVLGRTSTFALSSSYSHGHVVLMELVAYPVECFMVGSEPWPSH